MLQRYLLLWLTLLSLLGYAWSAAGARWGGALAELNPFLLSKPYLPLLIAVAMFAIGWMLPRDEVRQVARRWPAVLAGTLVQYTFMPLAAYCVGHLLGFKGDLLIGIIMVGCVPGAMASNVLTLLAKGNASYSVSLTTSATLLSPLAVPLILRLALGEEKVTNDMMWGGAISLVAMVVIPVVVGNLFSRWLPQFEKQAKVIGSGVANLSILWVIAVVVAMNHELLAGVSLLALLPWALLSINLAGYAAGYTAGLGLRLPEPMRRALTLEIGMQNAGLGAALAAGLFSDTVALPPALYTFGCMLTGTILAQWWARRTLASEAVLQSDPAVVPPVND